MKKLIDAKVIRTSENEDGFFIAFNANVNGAHTWRVRRTKSGRFECPMCLQRLITLETIETHLRTPHHSCPHCIGWFINLKQHLRTHRVRVKDLQKLEKDAIDFVGKYVGENYSLYEIDKAIGNAFSYFVPE